MPYTLYYTGLEPPRLESTPQGFQIHHFATIDIQYLQPELTPEIRAFLRTAPILVFSSRHGVAGFELWIQKTGLNLQRNSTSWWCIGSRTARACEERFGRPVRMPRAPTSRGLIEAFRDLAPVPVLLVQARNGWPEFPDWLTEQGWKIQRLDVYLTRSRPNPELQAAFRNTPEELLFFTAPSTVEGFVSGRGRKTLHDLRARIVTIGPVTSRAVRERGGRVYWEAEEPNPARILRIVQERL